MLAEGTGALHIALGESIRSVIEDVYADCGDSDPGVLSSNIARRLAGDLPTAILAAQPQREPSDADALIAIRDDIVRNYGRADAAVLAGIERLAARAARG